LLTQGNLGDHTNYGPGGSPTFDQITSNAAGTERHVQFALKFFF